MQYKRLVWRVAPESLLNLRPHGRATAAFFFMSKRNGCASAHAKRGGAVQSKGGSLAALEYNGAFADLTKKRIAEFHRCPRREREFDFVVL
jgi:hypothetical protein